MPEQLDDIAGRWEAGDRVFSFNTSGSTGAPKTIQHTRALLEWSALQTGKAIQVRPDDHQLICLPLDKTAGFMQVVRSLVWKIPMTVAQTCSDPMSGLPADHPYTIVSLTPAQLYAAMQAEAGQERLRRFRIILLGGDAVSPKLEQRCLEAGIHFLHTYGMTETASHIALRKAGNAAFYALEGVNIGVDEADGHLSVFLEAFPEMGRLHTRDAAELLPDGGFRLPGRLDNVINSGGVKIAPEPIEAALAAESVLQDRAFALAWLPDEELGQRAVLAVHGAPFPIDLQALRTICETVQRYGYPRAICFVDHWPLSDNGKLLRKELLAILQRGDAIHVSSIS